MLENSNGEMASGEEKKLSILDLPLEATASIIEKLDFPTRFALRKSCRCLKEAESLARFDVEELVLGRTGDAEFTLSVKDRLSDSWMFVQYQEGTNVHRWKDEDEHSYDDMKTKCFNTPFKKEETPLGDMAAIMQEYCNRSTIGTVKIDGFHCSDTSMAQLCGLLRNNKSIDRLFLTAPFSTTSDSGLYELLHDCPKLRSVQFAIHRCAPKEVVLEKEFLLFATSRVETLILHSRGLRKPHSVDNSEIDDNVLLRLLSNKCSRLELLYFLPLLTAEGIVAAIKHLDTRSEEKVSFKAYFRTELFSPLWHLLGVDIGGLVNSVASAIKISSDSRVIYDTHKSVRRVKAVHRFTEYCKITVERENIPVSKWEVMDIDLD